MPATTLSQISPHVYWMSPGKPDRPSLAAVAGSDFTFMLDGAASEAHARLFLAALANVQVAAPRFIALTHWHWDHVFGAATFGVPVIAHRQTAVWVAEMAQKDWSNAALDARVAAGEELVMLANDIKEELPEPRSIQFALPQLVYDESLEIRAGDVTIMLHHVGGDHAADSCVAYVLPDKVLFLGDCLYMGFLPVWHYTDQLLTLITTLEQFDADYFIEGHGETVLSRAEFEQMVQQMRLAHQLVAELGTDENAVKAAAEAHLGAAPDEDMTYFIEMFIAGKRLAQ